MVDNFQFLDSKKGEEQNTSYQSNQDHEITNAPDVPDDSAGNPFSDDDIPF